MLNLSHRLLVIGLDGATYDVFLPLARRGIMPHLAELLERGAWGRLESTLPPFTAAAWSTFSTGVNPGRHGLIAFQTRDRYNYGAHSGDFVSADQLELTVWEVLSEYGKRVGVLNVPVTYPTRPVNGFMVSGMLTPPGAERATYPAEFVRRLGSDYVFDLDFLRGQEGFALESLPAREELLDRIIDMTSMRLKTCELLLREEPWDFFGVVFTGTDRLLHFFWDDVETVLDEARRSEAALTAVQKGILAYFRLLDAGMGHLLEACDEGTSVMLVSDHGFGPAPTHRFYVNVWLEHLGLLQRRGSKGLMDLEYWRVKVGRQRHLKRLLRRLLPESAQARAKRVAESSSGAIIDWSTSSAYFVPIYFHVCGVEVNLQGRQRDGCVDSAAYEDVRSRIIEAARELRQEDGCPLVTKAARREVLFTGPYVDSFPDVILVLDPDYIGGASLASTSYIEHHVPIRAGEHRQSGIFLASGPHIRAGADLPGLCLEDVPATMVYCLGLPVPSYFDGRVMTGIFDTEHLRAHPVETRSNPAWDQAFTTVAETHHQHSERSESQLADRLRGLGYLE